MRYSNLEATRLIFAYILSCLFVMSCKQAVYHTEEPKLKADSVKTLSTSKIDSLSLNSSENIIDSFPVGFVDLLKRDSSILIDIRYATDSNFTHHSLYPCARCILKEEIVKKLLEVNQDLIKKGYKLKLLDCYRPLSVQKKLWEINPDPRFVMSPARGSGHSRGTAVDLTLVSLNGKELDMGSTYDEFSERAYYNYSGISSEVKRLRWLLKSTMKAHGFNPIRTEWWHFQFGYRTSENIMNFIWNCK